MTIPQTAINADPAPGVPGDFCSANPRSSMLAGPGTLIAGPNGALVGRFGFARNDNGQVSNNHPGVACRIGFIHRNQTALITTWLAFSGNLVQPGLEMTLFSDGEFWMGPFAAGAAIGQKVFVSYADGSVSAGAAGSSATGTAITADTTSGSATLANLSGPLLSGQPVSGTGIPANSFVVTGGATGGSATISANATATATGVSVTPTTAKETPWFVESIAAAGEIAMTSQRG